MVCGVAALVTSRVCQFYFFYVSCWQPRDSYCTFFRIPKKYVTITDNDIKWFIWACYLFFSSWFFVTLIAKWLVVEYLVTNVIIISSALLYFPIYLSIRKLAHLASAKVNKPRRYVFWQMFVLLVTKLVGLIKSRYICISVCFQMSIPAIIYHRNKEIDDVVYMCMLLDTISTPLVIQASYLGCNRRNLKDISKLKWRELWKIFKNPTASIYRVEPVLPTACTQECTKL